MIVHHVELKYVTYILSTDSLTNLSSFPQTNKQTPVATQYHIAGNFGSSYLEV